MWPFLGVGASAAAWLLPLTTPHCPTVPPIQGAMVPMVQWLAEGASPSLGHGLPGWTPQTGGGWVMWEQLGEAGAGG